MKALPQLTAPSAVPEHNNAALPRCLDRRAFLGNSTMLAVGALLATACGDGQLGGSVTDPGTVALTVKITDYPTLAAAGGVARLNGTNTPIAVVRQSATQFRAFSMVCPHEGTIIGVNGTGFLCPNHEARFSGTGQWLGGQRTSNLREFTITSDLTAGTITIAN